MKCRYLAAIGLIWFLTCQFAVAQDERTTQKLPMPDQASLARQERTIKELFKSDFAKKFPSEILQLANNLVSQAQETKDDPASRYVLYREASYLAARAGEFAGALAVLDELGREFDTDIAPLKIAALKMALEKGPSGNSGPFNNRYFSEAALFVFPDAIASSDPQTANELLSLAETAAKAAANEQLMERIKARRADLTEVLKQFEDFQGGQAKLVMKADDPSASLAVGRYLCFIKGDWKQGLPLLKQGNDEKLRSAAARDLGKPTDPGAQIQLADDWFDLADGQIRAAKRQISGRAARWYSEAAPKVTGISYTKARDRAIAIYKQFPGLKDGSSDNVSIFSEYRGVWEIRYTNNVLRYYVLDSRGNAFFLMHGAIHRGRLIPSGSRMLLSVGRGQYGMDKITLKDGEMRIDFFWPPGKLFSTGIGVRKTQPDDLASGTVKIDEPAGTDSKVDDDMKNLAGTWLIKYTNEVLRIYQIGKKGDVVGVLDYNRALPSKLTKIEDPNAAQGSTETRYLIDHKDNTMERVWISGGKLRIDHFYPASRYPAGKVDPLGIGIRVSD